jgi:3',5'-cyclic AMP phosphodiesterase CpdA
VSPRILHVSDLHFGAGRAKREPRVGEALRELVERLDPALVLASGDLTHRGTPRQHDEAAGFLRELGRPLLVVPGNHDVPHTLPGRFTHTWREFERCWETTEPVHATAALQVVGLNSVRPWRYQSGGIRDAQLQLAAERLGAAQPGALGVVALHHQLVNSPWRTRKRPVSRRAHVLARLVEAGAELIVGGHVHQGTIAERHEFEVVADGARGVVVTTAPGFGRPRPNRRGEARGLLVYDADERAIGVETYIWRREDWALTARREFPRGPDLSPAGPSR